MRATAPISRPCAGGAELDAASLRLEGGIADVPSGLHLGLEPLAGKDGSRPANGAGLYGPLSSA
jgi:hypothetical protein